MNVGEITDTTATYFVICTFPADSWEDAVHKQKVLDFIMCELRFDVDVSQPAIVQVPSFDDEKA